METACYGNTSNLNLKLYFLVKEKMVLCGKLTKNGTKCKLKTPCRYHVSSSNSAGKSSRKRVNPPVKRTNNKPFLEALKAAASAFKECKIPFHLHCGTALGAHRERDFIPHDDDIDIGVFAWDYNPILLSAMKKHGFSAKYTKQRAKHTGSNDMFLGKYSRGKELSFRYKNDVPLDIFLVYFDFDQNNNLFYWIASYFGVCDTKEERMCQWKYRPYSPVSIMFNGDRYKVVPKQTLVDMYGETWHTPIKFTYDEGIEQGLYKGLI